MPSPASGRDRSDLHRLVLLAVLLVALGLRLWGLFSWPLEQDELYTIRDSVGYRFGASSQRPVYFALQHFLSRLVPLDPGGLRLMPLLFGVGGVAMTWKLGKRVVGRRAGLVAAFLVTVSPWHLYESQIARYWTLIYLLAALYLYLMVSAVDSGRWRTYAAAGAVALVGTFTHPTFLFPMAGAVLGAALVSDGNGVGGSAIAWRKLLALSAPLLIIAFVWYAVNSGAADLTDPYPGRPTRGWGAILRLVPAMAQWLGPATAVAAVLGTAVLFVTRRTGDRRWAAMSLLGVGSTVAIMLFYSMKTEVYADYGMSMLPFAFVAIGGGVERAAERMEEGTGGWFAAAAALVLAAGTMPGTVSHLVDGSRFEYRPSLRYIERHDPNRPVLGWPRVVLEHYAPDLQIEELRLSRAFLDRALRREGDFWLLLSFRRYGLVGGARTVVPWVDENCRRATRTQSLRLDFREYRVELYRCREQPGRQA